MLRGHSLPDVGGDLLRELGETITQHLPELVVAVLGRLDRQGKVVAEVVRESHFAWSLEPWPAQLRQRCMSRIQPRPKILDLGGLLGDGRPIVANPPVVQYAGQDIEG